MDEGSPLHEMFVTASKATPGLAFISLVNTLLDCEQPESIVDIEFDRDYELAMYHATVALYG